VQIGITYSVRGDHAATNGAPHLQRTDDVEEEFDSPATIEALADSLRSQGHDVELLGEGEPLLRRLLNGPRPDLVFNIAEGRGIGRSREARVPAILEALGIPYTGSDPLTLAVTLDKDCAKRLVRDAGVATPRWVLVDADLPEAQVQTQASGLRFPVFIKPAFEGSSKGIRASKSLVQHREQLLPAIRELRELYQQPILAEEFIDGDELTVGLVGNRPPQVLGIMRVLPRDQRGPFVYSLEIKRDWERLVRYECPAQLSDDDTEAVKQAALTCWRALGCRDVSRIDFRLRDGVPYFLETNPLPGLSPLSGDIVLLSGLVGISHRDLVARIVAAAMDRQQRVQCATASQKQCCEA
jgi:D-alanine-D-alanine ligase